jgi:hypothetical protein
MLLYICKKVNSKIMRGKIMKKRMFALLLCVALLLGFVPTNYVHAVSENTELTEEEQAILQARREAVYNEMYKMGKVCPY